jgi:hypothetical protein
MGFGDFFRRLRGDRRAMPDPDSPEFQEAVQGSALPGSTEMGQGGWASASAAPAPGMPGSMAPAAGGETSFFGTGGEPAAVTPESLIAAGVPPEHAQQAAAAMAQLQQGSHTLDLQGMEGLRDEMREAMRRHGVDPDSGVAMDPSSVPGLQEALLGVLARNGVDLSQYWGR